MAEIILTGLRREFGDVVAVDDIDATFPDGSFTVLLGPSGCGKTTTLNMIAGLETVTAGAVAFDGVEVQDLPPHRRDVAMVFQSYALYPNRSVAANIAFPLRMRGSGRKASRVRVEQIASRLSIVELLDRYPRALSGGQQQRVALARAMVRTPKVFLLDEPLSNLDAQLRADMRFELKALQQDLGHTFVHVTHDQAEAMSLADQLVVMSGGRIQQAGTPDEVYTSPANTFVAGFVGTPRMNMVPGRLTDGVFQASGWRVELPGPVVGAGEVILGIRSEQVRVEAAPDGADGRVRVVETLGADAYVDIETEFGRVVARVEPDTGLRPDAPVRVGISGRYHLFDGAGGQRVSPPKGRARMDELIGHPA